MKILRKRASGKSSRAESDLVAEGGNVLASDDAPVSTAEIAHPAAITQHDACTMSKLGRWIARVIKSWTWPSRSRVLDDVSALRGSCARCRRGGRRARDVAGHADAGDARGLALALLATLATVLLGRGHRPFSCLCWWALSSPIR